jgi:toxin ParE1/3/4
MSFRLSKAAELDLLNIWRYTCQTWSESQADKYLDKLDAVCSKIGTEELTVKHMPDVHPDLCYRHYGRHYVFWLAKPEPIVIAFLHDRMELVKHLSDRMSDR